MGHDEAVYSAKRMPPRRFVPTSVKLYRMSAKTFGLCEIFFPKYLFFLFCLLHLVSKLSSTTIFFYTEMQLQGQNYPGRESMLDFVSGLLDAPWQSLFMETAWI